MKSTFLFAHLAMLFCHVSIASDALFIHEPYWSYDRSGLTAYAQRMVKTISPYFIREEQIDRTRDLISQNDISIKVRKIDEFGRVLPNIFLSQVLSHLGNNKLSTPRIFLLPKKDTPISFTFLLPHRNMRCDSGYNCIQVLSDSFEIFQEYIEGHSEVGDKSFFPFGHADFNQKQIITSTKDGKKYLIDTKEQKNFFLPQLSPYKDAYPSYWLFNIGRSLPQNPSTFEPWQFKKRAQMIRVSEKNFAENTNSMVVDLGPLKDIPVATLSPINYASTIFDDNNQTETYFPAVNHNIARYLYLERLDLLDRLISTNHDLPLQNIAIPYSSYGSTKMLNPVQFVLVNNQFSLEQKRHVLKIFSKEKLYFTLEAAKDDMNSWPLYLALLTEDQDIFSSVLRISGDVKSKIGPKSILEHALDMLAARKDDSQKLTKITNAILQQSDEHHISESLNQLINDTSLKDHAIKKKLAQLVITYLHHANASLITQLFKFGDKDLIEQILALQFDYSAMLSSTMDNIKDPGHDSIRQARGDFSPIDYFWYELAERILAQKSNYPDAETAIDSAISHALTNNKVKVLCLLLKNMPAKIPLTIQKLQAIKRLPYSPALLLESAITQKCPLAVELLVTHGFSPSIINIRAALSAFNNGTMIDALLKDPRLDIHSALNEAIDYVDKASAMKFLQELYAQGRMPTTENYRKIFQSDDAALKSLVESHRDKSSSGLMFMRHWDIQKIIDQKDIKTLDYLVDHNIDLGHVLTELVRHIIFAKDNKVTLGSEWFELLNKLCQKDLPVDAVDDAMESALVNSRTDIAKKLAPHLIKMDTNENLPKIKNIIKRNVANVYMRKRYFQDALDTGSIILVKLYLDAGMSITKNDLWYTPAGADSIEALLQKATQH